MPNIPPLVSHRPDSQALYASYTVTGGGGGGGVANPMTANLDGGAYNITNLTGLQFVSGKGNLTNISSINNAVYPPVAGGALIFNNASKAVKVGGTAALAPNSTTQLTTFTVNHDYGVPALTLQVLAQAQINGLEISTTTVATPGDRLVFFFAINSQNTEPQTTLNQGSTIPGVGGSQPVPLSVVSNLGNATQGAGSYVFGLFVFYGTSGTNDFQLITNAFTTTGQTFACIPN